ncbi:MAG TPA: glycoside hydrolase family 88 protein [Puia sp.]|nr:glycoside hydrolase family 88 protein [Puia sp.]
MRVIIFCLLLWCGFRVTGRGQDGQIGGRGQGEQMTGRGEEAQLAGRLASTAMRLWGDSGESAGSMRRADSQGRAKWTDEQAVVWLGMMRLWYSTGDARYFAYVKHSVDRLVDKDGNIFGYRPEDYSLDNILGGRVLLDLYEVTLDPRYYKAATRLREQLRDQPRTAEGSFWHKKKYPQQVWLDGLYMAMPFWAQYAALNHEDSVFDDIAHQFAVIERHTRDPKTGLLYHGWDESGSEKWAVKTGDVTSGHSPNFWGRAMGWYGMALVDALDYFPKGHPGRDTLIAILGRYAKAARMVEESSASAMMIYTMARGAREGYLPPVFRPIAELGFLMLPMKEKIVDNDPKGIGAVLLAAVAVGEAKTSYDPGTKTLSPAYKTVLLDYYFNNERRKDITGAMIRYHYTWEDRANSGFSLWGHLFRQFGANTDSLPVAPTAENLKKAAVYIIVDPDDDREVPDPHYLMPEETGVIADWVKAGGVLVLMSNDSANAEFGHFNVLAGTFGIRFNYDDYHKVIGNRFEMGAFGIPARDTIFKTAHKIYIKELSTLRVRPPAQAHFTADGHVIMAVAKVGKGTVFAVGDPWFYNEYTDGRKLPPDFENYNAARDLAQWLLRQAH